MVAALVIAVVLAIAILVLAEQAPARRRRRAGSLGALEREYARLLQMPEKPAHETLSRVLGEMEQAYPGRSREWRLRKMISDLRRDRQ